MLINILMENIMGTKAKETDLLMRIESELPLMSKGQKKIAEFILHNYDKATFMTAATLGIKVGVSESTVVRFATRLGFNGYPKLQKALQEIVKNKLTTLQRVDITNEMFKNNDILESVMNLDIAKIRATLENIDRSEFSKAVDAISNADNIYVLGTRSSFALSQFMTFYLNYMFKHVRNVNSNSSSGIFDQIFKISENDVFIAIGFPRYSMTTIKATRFAKDKNVTTIAITDREDSPLGECADVTLVARSDVISFVDTLVAPLSLINSLIIALAIKNKDDIPATFNELENIWKEYEVYQSKI